MAARILVVEDNEANLELMVYLLNAFGYQTVTATDGREGLAQAISEKPDLIVCDLELPKLDGYELARLVRQHARGAVIPLVAVTAFAMVGDRDRILASGFDGYIPKPINPHIFVHQVAGFLPEARRLSHTLHPHEITAEPVERTATRGTIMVVDDSPVNVSLIRSMLEPFGYQVVTTRGPQEALAQIQRRQPDLVLCDLHMYPISGLDFLRAVQADAQLRSTPVILITTSEGPSVERSEALGLGARSFLSRPIEPQALMAEIEKCLSEARRSPRGDHSDSR